MFHCDFNSVRERDMDMIFAEAFLTDEDFARLVMRKADFSDEPFEIVSVALSRTEAELGESDITVIVDVNGDKWGLLIEDKIDAVSMPNQYERYVKRGLKGIALEDYKNYKVLIFCPEKYYLQNKEAKKYPYHVFYEDCKTYFDEKEDRISKLRSQQFSQALSKAKRPPEIMLNEAANLFLKKYRAYQREFYPALNLRTSEKANGWWVRYSTRLGKVYLYHKMQEGCADLTFPNAAERMQPIYEMADWLRVHKVTGVEAVQTGRAGAVRIRVPRLTVTSDFDAVADEDIKKCFEAVKELTALANLIMDISGISSLGKNAADK